MTLTVCCQILSDSLVPRDKKKTLKLPNRYTLYHELREWNSELLSGDIQICHRWRWRHSWINLGNWKLHLYIWVETVDTETLDIPGFTWLALRSSFCCTRLFGPRRSFWSWQAGASTNKYSGRANKYVVLTIPA